MTASNPPGDPDRSETPWHEPPSPQGYPPPGQAYPPPSYPTPGPQGGYGRPAGYGGTGPVHPADTSPTDRNWAVGAHLSGFVAAWVALGFLGPLAVLLVAGSTSPFVRRHAVEALNFNLSVLLYVAVSVVLIAVLVGFVLLPIIALVYLIATIRGALAASRGEDFRYPVTIRLIK
jgi:uncharacterized Tic20 family protein